MQPTAAARPQLIPTLCALNNPMRLPNGDKAVVEEKKVREYLLSGSHPVGRFKARFFAGIGFGSERWQELVAALVNIAATGQAELVAENERGRKYRVFGTIPGPGGRNVGVVSVWVVGPEGDRPRLVTVYPR